MTFKKHHHTLCRHRRRWWENTSHKPDGAMTSRYSQKCKCHEIYNHPRYQQPSWGSCVGMTGKENKNRKGRTKLIRMIRDRLRLRESPFYARALQVCYDLQDPMMRFSLESLLSVSKSTIPCGYYAINSRLCFTSAIYPIILAYASLISRTSSLRTTERANIPERNARNDQ